MITMCHLILWTQCFCGTVIVQPVFIVLLEKLIDHCAAGWSWSAELCIFEKLVLLKEQKWAKILSDHCAPGWSCSERMCRFENLVHLKEQRNEQKILSLRIGTLWFSFFCGHMVYVAIVIDLPVIKGEKNWKIFIRRSG